MSRFSLVGPSYTMQSILADDQKTLNLYPEADESGQGASAIILLPTPGLRPFANAPNDTPTRGQIKVNNRSFAVMGSKFFEVMADGSLVLKGTIANDSKPITMASGPDQILFCSVGAVYVYTISTNSFEALAPNLFVGPVARVGQCDSFFIALIKDTNQFQVSAPEDATDWDVTVITGINVFSENAQSMIVDHRLLWIFGPTESVVYYDSGAPNFPFDVVAGGFVEQGISAPDSVAQLDNSVFWLGGSNLGARIAWRASGYTPVRISNHAVETAWESYARIDDAVAYTYVDQGHSFYVLYFPTAKKTWVYDAATQMWHERDRWLAGSGLSQAHPSWNHQFMFGKHIVGDWGSGTLYEMNVNIYTDNGGPIRRVRRAPHISVEQEWMFHHQLQVYMDVGLGPMPPLLDGYGQPRGPQIVLRWSNDGGRTWSSEHTRDCGQAGKYKTRVIYRRLGKARDRIYELSMSDPVPYRIVDAYLKATPGYEPQERLAKTYGKVQ